MQAGTLVLQGAERLADTGTLAVASGATLTLAATETLASASIAGTLAGSGTLVAASYAVDGGTVSANLGSIDVTVGDDLPSGTRLGTVGNSDGASRLYFELRSGTKTLPPTDWFGI